jgi:hypothetical protein
MRSTVTGSQMTDLVTLLSLDPARRAVVIVLIRDSLHLICVDEFSVQRGILCRLLNKLKPNVSALIYVR